MNWKVTAILGISLLLAGCEHTRQAIISDFCQGSNIIRPSRKDTSETLRQVAAANAKYRALCAEVKPQWSR